MLRRVPSAGSIRWQRPSLPRVLGGEFPGFGGTMALCDSLGPWHHPSLPSRGATRRRVCRFAPSGPEHQTAGRGFVSRFPSPATYAWRPSGPPKFLENPRVPMPCSSTPAGPTHQATVQWSRRGPRYVHDEGSHDTLTFEAQSHGFGTRCLRFVVWVAPGPRKTRFPLLARSTGRDWLPAGFFRKVSEVRLTSHPPFPGFAWRKDMIQFGGHVLGAP